MAPFSLAMINESSGSIISDRWKLHGLLQQEEWFRVATLPRFRMLHPSKFHRSEFGGGCGERPLLFDFDMELSVNSKSCTTRWIVQPLYDTTSILKIFCWPSRQTPSYSCRARTNISLSSRFLTAIRIYWFPFLIFSVRSFTRIFFSVKHSTNHGCFLFSVGTSNNSPVTDKQ